MTEEMLNLGEDRQLSPAVVRSTDPVILPQPYVQPTDFTAQYPQPLDTTEIIAMCEEISVWNFLPEKQTSLNAEYWRELDALAFSSGSSYIAFADGECPEEFEHAGDNMTVSIKNIGAKKTLSQRDIKHSVAVAGANWHGINTLVGPSNAFEGLPGTNDPGTFVRQHVAGVKEKEMRLASTLVLNGWDRLLVQGSTHTNSLEFTGIEQWAHEQACNFHTGSNTASGTFSATSFDRFLSEGCATPTVIMGNPAAIQEVMMAYFSLGYQGSQIVNHADGNRIVPGFNFSSFVNTGVGRLQVVADYNFRKTDIGGGAFQADLWVFRMTHNGEPMVYKVTQIPLSMTDLAPGCTAVSFEVWAATALVIKACCMHGKYITQMTGRVLTTCTSIG